MYETDTSEAEAPAEQGSGSPPPYNFIDLKEQSGSHQGILTRTIKLHAHIIMHKTVVKSMNAHSNNKGDVTY